MRSVTIKILIVLTALIVATATVLADQFDLDYPHNATNTINCWSCHYYTNNPADWAKHTPQDLDDTPWNKLCWSCHNDSDAAYAKTHSSLAASDQYGDWTLECKTCHWAHHQSQLRAYGAESYLYTATTAQATADTLTRSGGAAWTDNQYAGYIVIPNTGQVAYNYKIVSNTADTLIVEGPIDLNKVTQGADTMAIIYGRLIRETIATPVSGNKPVRFFKPTGSKSFADGDATRDGICEVCHTQVEHFTNDGSAVEQNHENLAGDQEGTDCVTCHKHDGFGHGGGVGCDTAIDCHGSHQPHLIHLDSMVGIGCSDCHGTEDFPLLSDGQDLANTTACNNCHSTDGAAYAKQYFHEATRWAATEGEASFCGSCHDATPGKNGATEAINILGDNTTYGYSITGHGRSTPYAALAWQDTSATGNPGAAQDCSGCHDLTSSHFSPTGKRLMAGYANDSNNSNCKQCHAPGSVADDDPQWYTTYTDYTNSAHNGKKCSDCHDVHGTAGPYKGMTLANQESLCYQCHTEGMVQNNAISGSVNDIQEAFSQAQRHDLGTQFTMGGKTYSLECASCHNVHLITGKYWQADSDKTPVTRISTPSNPTGNLTVWGDEAGEKMDDYAAQASGTGGWYYKTAEGYADNSSGLPFDRPAFYQPPKTGSNPDYEFDGANLPDYSTFCLDCHSSAVGGGAQGAVNWNVAHGKTAANMPGFVSDSGTPGNWGANGNPDVIFDMEYVTRGRGTAGHFMRWPYDSLQRSAGINFVMSCTDCHEAHGSGIGSMLRSTVNSGSGSTTWNTMCNNCHYYYDGQHAGMSCGVASCHGQNSIHRISSAGGGGSTKLHLTASGYEGNFQRPDFTPEIETVVGYVDSNDLRVTFRESRYGAGTPGIFTNEDLSGALGPDDFWLFDKNGNNPRTITAVSHNAGNTAAVITMSAPLAVADIDSDILATRGMSLWGWYEGGYNNAATGAVPAQAVSAGPWPVTVTEAPPLVQGVLYGSMQLKLNGIINDSNQFYVTFAEDAYSNNGGGGDLQAGDFALTCGARTISSVTHTAGDSFAILTLNTIVNQSEVGVCTVAAAPDSIFDSYGISAGTAAVTLALPPEALVNDLILRWNFNEGAGTVANSTGALGTQEDMHGVLTRNVVRVASTKPGAAAGDNAVKLDRVSDMGAVQLNYTVNPDDGFPPATYNNGGAPVIVQETQYTGEFSFSAWIKPTALGCQEGKDLGLNNKLRRDVLTTQLWIKNWAIAIIRFSDDGDPLNGNCTDEDSTHDVLRFWVAVGDPTDMRCDPYGGSWPETVYPVSPAGYIQGNYLQPTDQAVCDSSANPILPTNNKKHSFAQTETSASGAPTYGGVALQPGQWQHIVGTWDGRYIRIYIDGQLAAQTDMGGAGSYVMLDDPHLWGGDLVGDDSVSRHVSSYFAVGARPKFSASGSPSGGAAYWNTNGFYDLESWTTYVGELDDVKYWKIALPLETIQD